MRESHAPALRRHTFVWARDGASAHEDVTCAPAHRPIVARWLAARRPLIVRRRLAPEALAMDAWALGLALPPSQGKRRIALTLRAQAIARTCAPPRVAQIVPHAPPHWRTPLRRLHDDAIRADLTLRVFGSFAWQMHTGLAYVGAASDIDLCWRPRSPVQLEAGIACLRDFERASGLHADGEVLFGEDDAVAWREWADDRAQPRVLVKSFDGVCLRSREELIAQLHDTSQVEGALQP